MNKKDIEDVQAMIDSLKGDQNLLEEVIKGNFSVTDHFVDNRKESPEMLELMENYFVTSIGGKTVVIKRVDINKQYDFIHFLRLKSNIKENLKIKKIVDDQVVYKIVEKPIVSRFLNDKAERFEEVVYKPSGNVKNGEYNFFNGWAYDAVENIKKCQNYLDHVFENICSLNEELYEYVLDWMAHIVQYPENKVDKAIVLRGDQGTGKGFFVQEFGSLLGESFHHLTNMGPLVGRFNSELANRLLVFADEITWGGKKSEGSSLKTFISENRIGIEFKGKDKIPMNNYSRLIIASNHDWVIPVESGDRRYVVIDVDDLCKEDKKYFTKIHKDMLNGGRQALMHLLLTRDLTQRDWSLIPYTSARDEQKMLTLDPHENWLYDALNGNLSAECTPWGLDVMPTRTLNVAIYGRFLEYMKSRYPNSYIKSSRELSTFLTKMSGSAVMKSNGDTYREFKSETEMRKRFEDFFDVDSAVWDILSS